MRRTRGNLMYHELIGLDILVADHTDSSLQGIKGKVIDETKKTLIIRTLTGKEKVVPKFGGVFLFKLSDTQKVEVRGSMIIGRPEERMKRYRGGRH